MDPLITATLIAWVVIRCWEALKAEWRHTRDRHVTDLGREHPTWSPGRVRRSAWYRAHAWWWGEIGGGFPTWRAAWAENRLVTQLAREKALTEGHARHADLKQAIADVQAERKAAAGDDPAPVDPEPGTGGKPALRVVRDGGEPAKGTTPEPPSPEPAPVLGAPAEPPAPEPPADGSPEPGNPEPVQPWTVQEDELLGAYRCIQRTGTDEDGPTYCAESTEDGRLYCPSHGSQPQDGTEETPGVLLGEAPADGEQMTAGTPGDPGYQSGDNPVAEINGGPVTAQADLETGDTPFDAMLTAHRQHTKQQRQIAGAAHDDLMAHAIAREFDRDPEYMASLQAIADSAEAAAVAAENAVRGLNARHADGAEYHGTGHDADASAFRPS